MDSLNISIVSYSKIFHLPWTYLYNGIQFYLLYFNRYSFCLFLLLSLRTGTLFLKIIPETLSLAYYKKKKKRNVIMVSLSQAMGLGECIFIELRGFNFSFLLHLWLFQKVMVAQNRKTEKQDYYCNLKFTKNYKRVCVMTII